MSATVASTVTAINNQTGVTGVTAEQDGSNVILKGDGVENVTFAAERLLIDRWYDSIDRADVVRLTRALRHSVSRLVPLMLPSRSCVYSDV